jgi:hypothetical protein
VTLLGSSCVEVVFKFKTDPLDALYVIPVSIMASFSPIESVMYILNESLVLVFIGFWI